MKDQTKRERGPENPERSPHAEERINNDPYEQDPGAGTSDDDRVNEADEREARQREGIQLTSTERLDDSTTAPAIHTGIPGQTSRGSYGIDSTTGQGTYIDPTGDAAADVGADALDRSAEHSSLNNGTIDGEGMNDEEVRP